MQLVFQDPYSSLDPKQSIADIVGEPLAIHTSMSRAQREQRVVRAPGPGRTGFPRPAPPAPRVLRRATPAHRDRTGPGPRTSAAGLRRAGQRPRRLHPVAGDQPVDRASARLGRRLPLHCPRSLGRPTYQRPDRGDVPRPDRRGGRRRRGLRATHPSLYGGAALLHSGSRPGPPARAEADHPPGRGRRNVRRRQGCRFRARCPFAMEVCAQRRARAVPHPGRHDRPLPSAHVGPDARGWHGPTPRRALGANRRRSEGERAPLLASSYSRINEYSDTRAHEGHSTNDRITRGGAERPAIRVDGRGGRGCRARALRRARVRRRDRRRDRRQRRGSRPRTFYRYFPSKEDILQVRIERRSDALRSALAARPDGEPPLLSLRVALEEVLTNEDLERIRTVDQCDRGDPQHLAGCLRGHSAEEPSGDGRVLRDPAGPPSGRARSERSRSRRPEASSKPHKPGGSSTAETWSPRCHEGLRVLELGTGTDAQTWTDTVAPSRVAEPSGRAAGRTNLLT